MLFDFFTQAWAWSTFVAPQYTCKAGLVAGKPVVHDLSFNLERAVSYPPSTPTVAPKAGAQPATHMPLELVLSIIEMAAYDRGGQPDIAILKSCSLVCKEWGMAAQKLLFRKVALDSMRTFRSFKKAVDPSTERGSTLGGAVRELQVVLDYGQPAHFSQHPFGQAVHMCPNLEDLEVSLYGVAGPGEEGELRLRRSAPSFDEHTLALLRSGPQVRRLSFSNWTDNHECLFQLLGVYQTLQRLSIGGTTPQLPQHGVSPFPSKLEALGMNFQTPPSMDFTNWLISPSTESLKSLTFERDPCPEFVDMIMDSLCLRSLAFPSSSSSDLAKRLEHARQNGVNLPLEFFRMDQPKINQLLFKALPASVKQLAFGVDRDTSLQPVIELVKTRNALEAVIVRLWDGGENHRLLPALKIACAHRGIELETEKDVLMYESLLA